MRALTFSFPPVSWRVPKMVPSSVDLPTPLGPKTAMNSPGCTSKSSPDHKGSTAAWLKETNIKLQRMVGLASLVMHKPDHLTLRGIRDWIRLLQSIQRSFGYPGESHRDRKSTRLNSSHV